MVCLRSGPGGGLSGRDDDLVDDPHREFQDATPETVSGRLWDWFRGVVRTRLEPGGPQSD